MYVLCFSPVIKKKNWHNLLQSSKLLPIIIGFDSKILLFECYSSIKTRELALFSGDKTQFGTGALTLYRVSLQNKAKKSCVYTS